MATFPVLRRPFTGWNTAGSLWSCGTDSHPGFFDGNFASDFIQSQMFRRPRVFRWESPNLLGGSRWLDPSLVRQRRTCNQTNQTELIGSVRSRQIVRDKHAHFAANLVSVGNSPIRQSAVRHPGDTAVARRIASPVQILIDRFHKITLESRGFCWSN